MKKQIVRMLAAVSSNDRRALEEGDPAALAWKILRSVTLTADQQTQVTQILQNNKSASQAAGQQLFLARCAYSEGVIGGSASLAQLAANLNTAQANVTALQTTILQQVSKILTSDQIATISAA